MRLIFRKDSVIVSFPRYLIGPMLCPCCRDSPRMEVGMETKHEGWTAAEHSYLECGTSVSVRPNNPQLWASKFHPLSVGGLGDEFGRAGQQSQIAQSIARTLSTVDPSGTWT